MSSYQFLDDLIREYLLFRGFVQTLKSFDLETKNEKEKGLRPDKVVDQILSLIANYDLQGLRDLWLHMNNKLFKRLDPVQVGAVSRLESGVLKLYVINCVQNKNMDKVKEFFEKMSNELQGQSDWKDWFALPFLTNPESNPLFVNFFARHWQDTLLLSLHNFFAIVFASLPPPKLADYSNTSTKIKRLKDENEAMRQTLLKHAKAEKLAPLDIPRPADVMDDFYIIASHDNYTSSASAPTENYAKGLRGFLKNITGSANANPQLSSSLKTSGGGGDKSRSLSRSRTPSNSSQPSAAAASKQHAPVKRVAKNTISSNLSTSLSGSTTISELESEQGSNSKIKAYLLLGQEEYLEHHSEVTQCRFSSSGYTIASSDVDGIVKIWSASPGPPTTYATFVSQSGVSALDWFPNSDRKFIYGTMSGTVRICDKDERKSNHEFNVDDSCFVKQITCSNMSNLVAIATEDLQGQNQGQLMLYDLKAMKSIESDLNASCCAANSTVTSCVFNHNAQMIITGNSDGKVRIFDLRKRDCISSWSLSEEPCQVLTLQMSGDETNIYALSSQAHFSAWSFIQTSQRVFDVQLEDSYFSQLELYPRAAWGKQFAFAGDGSHLLVCSTNGGVIYQVDEDEGKLVKVLGLKGHKRHATCTDWSASNDCGPCVTAGFDGQIRISTLLSQ